MIKRESFYDQFGHAAFDGAPKKEAPAVPAHTVIVMADRAADTGNIISKGTREIWMISLKIFSGICSMDKAAAAVSREVVLAATAVLEAASEAAALAETSEAAGEVAMVMALGGFGSQKGADMTASVIISLEEAAFGCKKVLSLKDPATGTVQSLEVRIPAGIETGKSIRLRGKGMPGANGGPGRGSSSSGNGRRETRI